MMIQNDSLTPEQHIGNALYNLGDAAWGMMGAILILALAIYFSARLIVKALRTSSQEMIKDFPSRDSRSAAVNHETD